MTTKVTFVLTLLGSLVLPLHAAHAFRFSPIYAVLTPDGKGKSTSFSIENNQSEKEAIQITVVRRDEQPDGKEVNVSAKDLFSIFPEQMILEPGQNRVLRVTWLGKEKVEQELPFRVIAQQLEVKGLEQKKTGNEVARIKILMAYKASIYVEPPNVSPEVVVEGPQIAPGKAGPELSMTFFNRGKKHQLFENTTLTVAFKDKSGKDQSIQLEGAALPGINEINVLPGNRHIYQVPWKGPPPDGPVTVALKIKNED